MKTENNLIFVEKPNYLSQETLVLILKKNKFTFKPINEYGNELFYCYIHFNVAKKISEKNNKFLDFINKIFNFNQERIIERKLSYSILDEEGYHVDVPIVFNRNEVINIIKDIPENYINNEKILYYEN